MIAGGLPQLPDPSGFATEWGYLGALVFLVIAFGGFLLKMDKSNKDYQDKRDTEWRAFFTAINADGKEDIKELASTMERMVTALDRHDDQAKEILGTVKRIDEHTQPTTARKGPSK